MRRSACFLCLLLLWLLMGCGGMDFSEAQKQMGQNAWYFMALQDLREDAMESAMENFRRGAKKSDPYFARKCLEGLSRLGSVRERIAVAEELHKRYPDNASLLRLVQELQAGEEYAQILALTERLEGDFSGELVALRLEALWCRYKSGFGGEVADWFLYEPITSHHLKFFTSHKDGLLADLLPVETLRCVELRVAVQRRDYNLADRILSELLLMQTNPALWITQQPEAMLSDIGRTYLYGSGRLMDGARLFGAALQYQDADTAAFVPFYLNFYIARFWDKGLGTGSQQVSERFLAAMEAAPTPENYDNALWYYLSTQLKVSADAAVEALERYISTICSPSYYSDFLDSLVRRLCSDRNWNGLLRCYTLIKEYADGETLSRYAYLSGRLVQLGQVDLDAFPQETLDELVGVRHGVAEETVEPQGAEQGVPVEETVSRGLFAAAYREGGDLYYRLLASVQLGYSPAVVRQSLYQTRLLEDFQRDADVELLLEGFMAFDLPERIYPLWQEHSTSIGLEVAQKAAAHLSLYGTDLYSAQGLRLMSNAIFHADTQTTEEMYRLAYPRLYAQEIAAAAQKYQLPEYLVFALIRSESFFDAAVSSHAGAVGLAQLMPATAGDIARKLKLTDYDLTNPQTSIEFGSFYLAELAGRLEGSVIEALYSYNAGITNVRNWKKYFPDLPEDLILELIPFTETRNYGKKIVSAAAVYGDLYYNKAHSDVVAEIMFQ